jgi:D-alanyl-D-alanine carboxypeptidase
MPFSGFQDLDPRFAQSLQALIAANGGITPFSGFRSIERQRQMFEASDKSGHMVAAPGHSQHNFGRAVDLRFADDAAREFAHANAAKYGLNFPMSWEPWHIEPIGARSGPHSSALQDQRGDTPSTDVSQPMPIADPSTGSVVGDYHRPLPFEPGYGGQQLAQSIIGGTLKSDLRAALFGRIASLFA